MKQTIKFEVDVEKIAQDLFEQDSVSGYGISSAVKDEVRRQARDQIVTTLLKGINIEEWLQKRDYYKPETLLSDMAKKAITDKLELLTDAFIKNWIKQNMKWVVEKSLRETLDGLLVPRLQKMIANMLIIDTESQEEQMKEMEEALKDQANAAYEAGQMSATEEIKRSL